MRKILLLLTAVTLQFPVMAQTPATPTISSFSDYYACRATGRSRSSFQPTTQRTIHSTRRSCSTTSISMTRPTPSPTTGIAR